MTARHAGSRSRTTVTRRWFAMSLGALTVCLWGAEDTAQAAEATSPFALIMVDDPACRFCRKFDAEVGPGYPHTREGRTAPLVKMRRGSYELEALALAPAIYTPTFILLRGRKEVGRITGYPGADFFFDELGGLLERSGSTYFLTPAPPQTASTRGL